jgi:hypothetical protein
LLQVGFLNDGNHALQNRFLSNLVKQTLQDYQEINFDSHLELKRSITKKQTQITLDYGEPSNYLASTPVPYLDDPVFIMTPHSVRKQIWFGLRVATVWLASFFALSLALSVLLANCECCSKPQRS